MPNKLPFTKHEEPILDFQEIFNEMPGNFLVLKPNIPYFTILAVSDDLLQITAQERSNVVGKGVFEVYPVNPDALTATGPSSLKRSLEEVIRTKKSIVLPVVRYDVPDETGSFEERHWWASNKPVIDKDNTVSYIIHTSFDVTDKVKAENKASQLLEELSLRKTKEDSNARFRNLVEQAPVAIAVFRGDNFVAEVANRSFLPLVGKTWEEFVGKPLFDSLPETRQKLEPIAREVVRSGKPFHANELEVELIRNGKARTCYFDCVWEPFHENDGSISGFVAVASEVTEQVLYRKKIEESEQQLRSFVESAPFPIGVYIGREMRIQFANKAMLRAYGKGSNVIGKLYTEVLSEIDPKIYAQLEKVITTGQPYHVKDEQIEVVMDGKPQTFIYDYSFLPLYDARGEIYGVINTAVDVTDLRLAYQRLALSEAQLQAVIDATPECIKIIDPDGTLQYMNPSGLEIIGGGAGMLGNSCVFDVIAPEHRDKWIKNHERICKGESLSWDFEIVTLTGKRRSMETHAVPLPGAKGTRHLAVTRDITERKKSELALQESEESFRMFANNIQNLAWMAEPDGWIFWYNQRWFEYTGTTLEEMLGWGWEKVHHPDYIDHVLAFVKEAWAKGETWEMTFPLRGHDGKYHWFLTRAYAVKDENGKVVRWIGTNTNVDSQKQAEAELEEKNKELTLINNDLDNFIYAASHDLKSPISNIEGLLLFLTEELKSGEGQGSEAAHIMHLMKGSVERFKKTIESLTDVVKLQQESSATKVMVSLPEVVRDVTLDLDSLIKEHGVQVHVDLDDCLLIHFSEKNLRSVVYNLMSNAIKYHSPTRVPEIFITCKSTDEHHILVVKDNGLGMKVGQEKQLFSMFKRFHDHVEGTGIGLYMVKKMVENVGGYIEVKSKLGEGTTFNVYFKQ
ncbi:PAS domain-containing sensor histidine kinase [Pontibacter sp. MBLB2868]|uniref:PAS domain-containing sensor histidine kinase n=1 Tax=Pontibacter sp. MBLB2868 TaxID=3451555 RepID=UPI003F7524D0